jgi:hypothetical protein
MSKCPEPVKERATARRGIADAMVDIIFDDFVMIQDDLMSEWIRMDESQRVSHSEKLQLSIEIVT